MFLCRKICQLSFSKMELKKNSEKQVNHYFRIFQLNCCFQSEPAIHDISSHRPYFTPPPLPPASVSFNQAAMQKNGKKASCIHYFPVHSLTIFSIKLLLPERTRDPWYLVSQTEFHPAAAAPCFCFLKPSGHAKKMVRKHLAFIIFQFLHSPFFN